MRCSEISRSAVIVLCLLGCNIWNAVTEAFREDSDAKEVALKVHLSDASTHQPLSDANVEVFANHTTVARETSGSDGNIFIRFPYRLGELLVITATKRGYVPNSAPWRPSRLPVFSSLSLNLLPERAATLIVYEDEVQIISGYQGSRLQPFVQFQRRALRLPPNVTYTNLTAFLTVTHSGQATQQFPYLQGLGSNSSGSDRRFELTPVAAISVHLLGNDGAELHVSEPISVSVPLPANSGLKENDHIPAWRFDPKLGAWLKSSLGYVQREGGGELILTYIAPQLGYWVAAMSPINTGPVVAKDISTYHTVFLLAILGGMALILLFLLCLLLCYCRRKCSRSRRANQKYSLTSLDSSKRDQATSMSHLNLINETQPDQLGVEPDLHTPMLNAAPHDSSTSELVSSRNELGNRSQRDYRRSYTSIVSSTVHPLHMSALSSSPYPLQHAASAGRLSSESKANPRELRLSPAMTSPTTSPERDLGSEHRPSDFLLSRSVDQLERPPGLLPRPGELLCCTSELQVSQGGAGYQKGRPTLLIPAHYMRLPGTHPLSGQALLLQSDERSELESIRAELNASHQPQAEVVQVDDMGEEIDEGNTGAREAGGGTVDEWTSTLPEALSIPNSLSEAALGVVQMNGEDQLLAEKTLMELRGGKPLPHPRAWFVSLDGRSNAHIRHSYIDLQRATHGTCSVGSNDASLDSGVDVSDVTPSRKNKGQEKNAVRTPNVACTSLVFMEDKVNAHSEPNESESQTPACSPEENSHKPLLPSSEVEEETIVPPSPPLLPTPPLPSPPPLPDPTIEEQEDSRVDTEQIVRTEHAQTHLKLPSSNSAPDGLAAPEDIDENKKSPWQKREERPLLSFNLK
ncbi:protein FAM171A1 isoform X1 [Silurus asotus]|uniref:Protein FAM171A1 isoform X1 n=1 Tax=Silurus asotus TaxID=30991 RepID=A0AAD5FDY0_SILAS|nr:protein FAM171A1 isoform X1 [Silurus asotus]